MKGVILQHFTGVLGELQEKSIRNISSYARSIGAAYELLRGDVFRKGLTPPCQKLFMLDQTWDEYDMVVMMDTDMFAVKGLSLSVFTDISGTGLFVPFTDEVFGKCRRRHPTLCDANYAYWGGCLWRLPLALRKKFRECINEEDLKAFSGNFEDEGMMHRLAVLTKTKQDQIPHSWSYCSYRPEVEKAHIIHIRKKASMTGPRVEKIDNYRALQSRGIIE